MDSNICSTFLELTCVSHNSITAVIAGVLFLTVVILTCVHTGKYASNRWKGNKGKTIAGFVLIFAIVEIVLFCFLFMCENYPRNNLLQYSFGMSIFFTSHHIFQDSCACLRCLYPASLQ